MGAGKSGIKPGKSRLEGPVPAVYPEFPAGFPLFPEPGAGGSPGPLPESLPAFVWVFQGIFRAGKAAQRSRPGRGGSGAVPKGHRGTVPVPRREGRDQSGAGTSPNVPRCHLRDLGTSRDLGTPRGCPPCPQGTLQGLGTRLRDVPSVPKGQQEQPQGQPWSVPWGQGRHPSTWGHPTDSSGMSPVSPGL